LGVWQRGASGSAAGDPTRQTGLQNHSTVRLRSADPADSPDIRFRYFEEGSPGWEDDLEAMVTGIRFVRRISDAMEHRVAEEEEPGRHRA